MFLCFSYKNLSYDIQCLKYYYYVYLLYEFKKKVIYVFYQYLFLIVKAFLSLKMVLCEISTNSYLSVTAFYKYGGKSLSVFNTRNYNHAQVNYTIWQDSK